MKVSLDLQFNTLDIIDIPSNISKDEVVNYILTNYASDRALNISKTKASYLGCTIIDIETDEVLEDN